MQTFTGIRHAVSVVVDNRVRVEVAGPRDPLSVALKERFTYQNPAYRTWKTFRKGAPPPKQILTWATEARGQWVTVPRGGFGVVLEEIRRLGRVESVRDETFDDDQPEESFELQTPLWPHQEQLIDSFWKFGAHAGTGVLHHHFANGIWRAPQGSGKTQAVLALICRLNSRSLIVVANGALFEQWCTRVRRELGFEPGVIRGPKRVVRSITIGMAQTLTKCASDYARTFGFVCLDECFTGDARVLLEDGRTVPIQNIRAGDRVALGGTVKAIRRQSFRGELYRVGDALATGEHPVATQRGWLAVSSMCERDEVWYDPSHASRVRGDRRIESLEAQIGCRPKEGREAVSPWLEGAALPGAVRLRRSCSLVSKRAGEFAGDVYNLETETGVFVAGGVLVHNCQLCPSETQQNVFEPLQARYRLGVSGDERRADGKEFLTYDTFGPVTCEVKRDQIERSGEVVDVEIRIVPTDFRADWYVALGADDPSDERQRTLAARAKVDARARLLEELTNDEARNVLAVDTAQIASGSNIGTSDAPGQQFVLLSDRREQCLRLEAMLAARRVRSGLFIGGDGYRQQFQATLAGMKNHSITAGVGTYQAIGVGFEANRELSIGVACTPCVFNPKSRMQFNQYRGRFARAAPGKTQGVFYYLWDRHVYGINPVRLLCKWNKSVQVQTPEGWVEGKRFLKDA